MTRATERQRRRIGWLAACAVLAGMLLYMAYREHRDTAPRAYRDTSPETSPSAPEAILAQAARERFATTTPRVTGFDGKPRPVTDPGRANALKVLHFKQLLVNEELARNPGLAEHADAHLRAGRPALVRVAWHSPAGEEWVEKIIADTVSCGLAELAVPAQLSFAQLEQLSCLYDDDPAYWDTVGTGVTVSLTPIGEDDMEWERLRGKQMRDIVAGMFVQRALQAQQQE